jgi:DNA-binding NtrC family response regulator
MRSVVLVESEMLISLILADFLQESGINVHQASRGRDAAKLIATGVEVELVITDLSVPHRAEGLALVLWLGEHRPDLSVTVAVDDQTKIDSVVRLNKLWIGRREPYDLSAAVRQMRSIVNARHMRERKPSLEEQGEWPQLAQHATETSAANQVRSSLGSE